MLNDIEDDEDEKFHEMERNRLICLLTNMNYSEDAIQREMAEYDRKNGYEPISLN